MNILSKKSFILILVLSLLLGHITITAFAADTTRKTIKITIVNSKGKKKSKEKTINIPAGSKADTFSPERCSVTKYAVPKNKGFKSFLRYKKITAPSRQLELQEVATTDEHGLRIVDNRYCIAIGTYFNAPVGTYVDLHLKNGTTIPCIVGDIKANKDTDKKNIFTRNGCCSEFIVDEAKLPRKTRTRGNISAINKKWNSPVNRIYVYDYRYKK